MVSCYPLRCMLLSQRYNDFTLALPVSIILDLLLQITVCRLLARDQISPMMGTVCSDLHGEPATSCWKYMTFTWVLLVCWNNHKSKNFWTEVYIHIRNWKIHYTLWVRRAYLTKRMLNSSENQSCTSHVFSFHTQRAIICYAATVGACY